MNRKLIWALALAAAPLAYAPTIACLLGRQHLATHLIAVSYAIEVLAIGAYIRHNVILPRYPYPGRRGGHGARRPAVAPIGAGWSASQFN